MKVSTRLHADNKTLVIDYSAESPEDYMANRALFARYDGTGLIGSASGDGSQLQLIVLPLTEAELRANAEADAAIEGLNLMQALCLDHRSAIEAETVLLPSGDILALNG